VASFENTQKRKGRAYVWGVGRLCRRCNQRVWRPHHAPDGLPKSHLNLLGDRVPCPKFIDPVYTCTVCGAERRSWTGKPPNGWVKGRGFKAKCTKCKRSK